MTGLGDFFPRWDKMTDRRRWEFLIKRSNAFLHSRGWKKAIIVLIRRHGPPERLMIYFKRRCWQKCQACLPKPRCKPRLVWTNLRPSTRLPCCRSVAKASRLVWDGCSASLGDPVPDGRGSAELHQHLCHGESDPLSQRWHSAHALFSFRVVLSGRWGAWKPRGGLGRNQSCRCWTPLGSALKKTKTPQTREAASNTRASREPGSSSDARPQESPLLLFSYSSWAALLSARLLCNHQAFPSA